MIMYNLLFNSIQFINFSRNSKPGEILFNRNKPYLKRQQKIEHS